MGPEEALACAVFRRALLDGDRRDNEAREFMTSGDSLAFFWAELAGISLTDLQLKAEGRWADDR